MNNFINNLINAAMESSSEYRVLKPASQPTVRYVRAYGNIPAANPEKPAEEKVPDEKPATPVRVKTPVQVQKPESAAPVEPVEENIGIRFDMTKQDLLTGFIMSEVLGKPKCFSMRRRPAGR